MAACSESGVTLLVAAASLPTATFFEIGVHAAGGCSIPIDCHAFPRLTCCWWLQLPYRLPHFEAFLPFARAEPG